MKLIIGTQNQWGFMEEPPININVDFHLHDENSPPWELRQRLKNLIKFDYKSEYNYNVLTTNVSILNMINDSFDITYDDVYIILNGKLYDLIEKKDSPLPGCIKNREWMTGFSLGHLYETGELYDHDDPKTDEFSKYLSSFA